MNKLFAACAAAIMCFSSVALCEEGGYVKTYAYGFPNPIGPTGMYGHKLNNRGDIPPLIVVDRIALGSPAEGIVVKDDLVVGVNGTPFAMKSDPRIALGYAMIDSESNDGVLRLTLKRRGNPLEVSIQLDRIPDYSPTWPLDCNRTDTMLMNACEFLSGQQMPEGVVPADEGYIGQTQAGLLWLAYGEPKYMENARRSAYWYMGWLQERERQGEGIPWGPWGSAYGGIFLAEYYMMTGDRGILPGIELLATIMADGQLPSGGYTHGFYDGLSAGYGELSLASMACYTSLLMAKACGVAVDTTKLRQAEVYFEKFAPPLVNRYGDHMYETQQLGYDPMNGKVGGLAVSHILNGKDTWSQGYAIKAARSMDEVEKGHTGHFFNILWTPVGASLAPAKDIATPWIRLAGITRMPGRRAAVSNAWEQAGSTGRCRP